MAQATVTASRRAMRGGPIAGFLRWWGGELAAALPEWLVAAVRPPREALLVSEAGTGWRIARMYGPKNEAEVLSELPAEADASAMGEAMRAARKRCRDPDPLVIQFYGGGRILRVPCVLPAAAMAAPRQTLAWEMDRYTPFTANQVCFDYLRTDSPEDGPDQVSISLVVVPREEIERCRKRLARLGVSPHVIDVPPETRDGATAPEDTQRITRSGLNLLPPADRPRQRRMVVWLNSGMAVLAAVLLIGPLYQGYVEQREYEARLEARVAEAREAADRALSLRREIQSIKDAGQVLERTLEERRVISDVLHGLTRALPSDAWLSRVVIRDDRITIEGRGDNTADIVARLERTLGFANTEFRVSGARQQDGEDQLPPRFNLTARLTGRPDEPPAANAGTTVDPESRSDLEHDAGRRGGES